MSYEIDYYLDEVNFCNAFSELIENNDFFGIKKLLRIFKDSHRECKFINLLLYKKNEDNITNFDLALKSNNKFIIQALVNFECNANKNLLHFVISNEDENVLDINFNIAKKILEQESLKDIINIKDNSNRTPIHLAMLNFQNHGYSMVEILLKQNNLNINLTNGIGLTPFDVIIEELNDNVKSFDDFINKIKDDLNLIKVNKTRVKDNSCLINDYLFTLGKLVELKSLNINAKDKNGNFPLCLIMENIYNILNNKCIFEDTKLYFSIRENYLNIFKKLISRDDYCINLKDTNGFSILNYAIKYNDLELFEILINSKNLDINLREDNSGYSLLHYTIERNNIDVFKILIENKDIDINIKDNNGYNIFHLAVTYGQLDIVKFLLEETNMNVNETIDDKITVLDLAVKNGDRDIIELLFNSEKYIKNEIDLTRTIQFAIKTGKRDIVEFFIENIGLDKILIYIEHNNSNFDFYFEKISRILFFSLLLEQNNNNVEKYEKLIKYAVENNKTNLIGKTIENIRNVNIQNEHGKTLLHYAIETKNQKLCNFLLLSPFININITDKYGKTPIDIAIKNKDIEMTRSLLKRSVSLKMFEKNIQFSPIFISIRNNNLDALKLLVSHENYMDDINEPIGYEGFTPLYYAVINNNYEVVDILLKNGADITAKTNIKNITIFNYVTPENHNMLDILLKNFKERIKIAIYNLNRFENDFKEKQKLLNNLAKNFKNAWYDYFKNKYVKQFNDELLKFSSISVNLEKQRCYNNKVKESFLGSLENINKEVLDYINKYDKNLIPSIEKM